MKETLDQKQQVPSFETTRVFKQPYRLYSTLGFIFDYARRSTASIAIWSSCAAAFRYQNNA